MVNHFARKFSVADPYSLLSHAVPSEPLNLDVLTIAGSPTELLVTWDPPAEPNGRSSLLVNQLGLSHKSLPGIGLTVPLMRKNNANPHSADNVAMTQSRI